MKTDDNLRREVKAAHKNWGEAMAQAQAEAAKHVLDWRNRTNAMAIEELFGNEDGPYGE